MSQLTDSMIAAARTTLACCSMSYLKKYSKSQKYGESDDYSRRAWIYTAWARDVMCRTYISSDASSYITEVTGAGTQGANGIYTVDPDGTANLDLPSLFLSTIDTSVGVWRNATGFGQGYAIIRLMNGSWHILSASQAGPIVYSAYTDLTNDPGHPHPYPGAGQTWIVREDGADPVPVVITYTSCVDRSFAQKVYEKASCYCEMCACTPNVASVTPTPPPPPACEITVDQTVNTVIDGADLANTQLANAVEGYSIYIVSLVGGSGPTPGQVSTYSSGMWTYASVPVGSIVEDTSSGNLWYQNAFPVYPSLYFAPIDCDSDETGTYLLQSRFPAYTSTDTRSIVVEMSTDNTNWDTVYTGSAATMATQQTISAVETGYYFIRTTYIDGECTYQYYDGLVTLIPNPPNSSRSMLFGTTDPIGTTRYGLMVPQTVTSFLNPVLDTQWTISFRFRFDVGNAANARRMLFSFVTSPSAMGPGSMWGVFFGIDSLSGGLYLTRAGNDWPNCSYAYNDPTVYDGNWHVFTLVRNAASFDDWSLGSGIKMYLDGVIVPLAIVSGANGSYTLPQVTGYSNLSTQIIGGGGAGNYALIDEIYVCRTARSLSDITTYIIPNNMEGNDGSWNRYTYHRIEDTDTATVVASVPSGTPLIRVPSASYNNELSTDIDPSL